MLAGGQMGEHRRRCVTDDQEMPARPDSLRQPASDIDHLAVWRVQEVGGDQVVGPAFGGEGPGIDLPPVDPGGDPCLIGVPGCPSQAVAREVRAGDPPTPAG